MQSVAGSESCAEKPSRLASSSVNVKKSMFWGRNNVSWQLLLMFQKNLLCHMH